MSLTNKQRAFISEYLKDFNATQAALRAGYSPKTAKAIGCENLTKPDIKAEIDASLDELSMTAEEAVLRMTELARGDLSEFFTFVEGIKQPDGRIEIELHDPKDALKEILRVRGAYAPDKKEISGNLTWREFLEDDEA